MSMLEPKQCAAVLSLFNDSFAAEVIGKMVNSHPADNDLVGAIGKTIADNIEDEKDMLQDMLMVAINEAISKIDEEINNVMGS